MKAGFRQKTAPRKLKFARGLRRVMTLEESLLWANLRRKSLGVRTRRQAVIRGYIVDFYVPAAKLVVEVDGDAHNDPIVARNDLIRQRNLEALGLKVVRFTNHQVFDGVEDVVAQIKAEVVRLTHPARSTRSE